MFKHIFVNRLKQLLRDKENIFWTLMFPLILAVFFQLALSNISSSENFKTIDIAVVNNSHFQDDEYFGKAIKSISEGEDRLFNLTLSNEEEAETLLSNNKIAGYIRVEDSISLVVKDSGINQNIVKSFLDNYIQTISAVNTIIKENPEKIEEVLDNINQHKTYLREVSATAAKPDTILNFFYSLIAMACFYGGFFGMREITDIQADISTLAARINVAPVHKLKTIVYSMSAAIFIHITEMFILLGFLRFVLNIDFGERTLYVLLTTIVGSFAGVLLGALISAIVKKSEGIKIAIVLTVSMLGSFLAGMMNTDIKYSIAQNVPLLSYINPVNLLTDALYSLYYYDNLSRYTLNMILLSVFVILSCTGVYLITRRRKYASL